jgi:hypothetical protein
MTQYPLRIPEHIMSQVREAAQEEDVSVNQMFLTFISEGVGHRRALKTLRDRAARGNPEEALAILHGLPVYAPEPGDEMPDGAKL